MIALRNCPVTFIAQPQLSSRGEIYNIFLEISRVCPILTVDEKAELSTLIFKRKFIK
jgi:hypothetical protein